MAPDDTTVGRTPTLSGGEASKKGLMLELMHFPEELLDASEFKALAAKSIRKNEMQMAERLIERMSSKWEPRG